MTRYLDDSGRRYGSARPEEESIRRRKLLYGAEYARNTIVVVEGPLDAWTIGPGAVATMGMPTRAQVARIARYPKRIMCLDSEGPAQKIAEQVNHQLESLSGTTIRVVFDSGKDASRAKPSELACLRRMMR